MVFSDQSFVFLFLPAALVLYFLLRSTPFALAIILVCLSASLNVDTGATLENLERTIPSSFLGKTADPNLVVPIPEQADCVRVAVEVPEPAVFEMYLPVIVGRDDSDSFAEGRSVALDLPAGKSVLTFMLPNGRVGKELRIDPVNAPWPFKLDEVAFGTFKEG